MAGDGLHGGFSPIRQLLNPKFDSYKLQALNQSEVVHSHPLPSPIAPAPISAQIILPFAEVEYRVRYNHLALGLNGRLVYISSSFEVIQAQIDPESLAPAFSHIVTLPKPSGVAPPLHPEYPTVVALTGNILAASDGAGRLYVLTAEVPNGSEPGKLLGSYQLSSGDSTDVLPFRLHHARLSGSDVLHCIVSVSTRKPTSSGSPNSLTYEKTSFTLMSVSCTIPRHPHDGLQTLTVDWALASDSLPLFFVHEPASKRYVIGSAAPFASSQTSVAVDEAYEPAADEIVPTPRAGEDLDGTKKEDTRPPPYSWTQTSDSVTVVFPLPASTPKAHIRVLFSEHSLTLLISERGEKTDFPLPVYVKKPFWDGIHSDTSYWTWDREAQSGSKAPSSIGLLSLHLDKQHEGTRWSHVFATVGTGAAGEEDVEVAETLDPSELWNIREALEKWTSDLASGQDMSGLGLGRGATSLTSGEMDDEIDVNVGSQVVFTYVTEDGKAECPAPQLPVDLLSSPFPHSLPSVVVKNTLDGLLFALPPDEPEPSYAWKHIATYPALAFVLASKRDTKFVYHYGPDVVLAFEGGTDIKGISGGNVYIYYGADGKTNARQAVLKVSGGTAGSLMGMQAVTLSDGRVVIACLCERELVLLKDVLSW